MLYTVEGVTPESVASSFRPDVPLSAQLLKTFCYYILDIHNVITKKILVDKTQARIRTCVIYGLLV